MTVLLLLSSENQWTYFWLIPHWMSYPLENFETTLISAFLAPSWFFRKVVFCGYKNRFSLAFLPLYSFLLSQINIHLLSSSSLHHAWGKLKNKEWQAENMFVITATQGLSPCVDVPSHFLHIVQSGNPLALPAGVWSSMAEPFWWLFRMLPYLSLRFLLFSFGNNFSIFLFSSL